jgi:hypothetical protein
VVWEAEEAGHLEERSGVERGGEEGSGRPALGARAGSAHGRGEFRTFAARLISSGMLWVIFLVAGGSDRSSPIQADVALVSAGFSSRGRFAADDDQGATAAASHGILPLLFPRPLSRHRRVAPLRVEVGLRAAIRPGGRSWVGFVSS